MFMVDLHATTSKFFESKFSSKSARVLNLGPNCLKTDFRYKILKYQCQSQRL